MLNGKSPVINIIIKEEIKTFEPDYRNIIDCPCNKEAKRLPLCEHNVAFEKIGEITGKDMLSLLQGDGRDLQEFSVFFVISSKTMDTMPLPLNDVSGKSCSEAALSGTAE